VCTPVLLCVIMSGFFIAYTRGVGALCLPSTGCTTALAYYTTKEGDTLDIVGNYFQVSTQAIMNANSNITNVDTVFAVESIYIPFACKCINGQLGQNFAYKVTGNDTLNSISTQIYEGLTQPGWIASQSGLANPNFIDEGAFLVIPVNCSCGNPTVSLEFGLFVTYVVGSGTADNLTSVAAKFNLSPDLVRKYNPGVSWDNPQQNAQQIAFIPVTDPEGNYPPYTGPPPASSAGGGGGGGGGGPAVSTSVIVGAVIGGLFGLIGVVAFLYCFCVRFLLWPSRRHHRNKFKQQGLLASDNSGTMSTPDRHKSRQ
jgi:LysM repeat protein